MPKRKREQKLHGTGRRRVFRVRAWILRLTLLGERQPVTPKPSCETSIAKNHRSVAGDHARLL